MKTQYVIGAAVVVVLLGVVFISTNSASKTTVAVQPSTQTPSTVSVGAAASSTNAVTGTSQTAEDIVPGLYPNQIKNTATAQGIKISSIMVENNTDAAGNAVSDHLQLTVQNVTGKTLSNFEAYYTVTDMASGKKEGYYKQLTGFTLPPHGSSTVHFDGQSGPWHYGVNMHGVYGTTVDTLKFHVEVSTPNYAPVYADATKAPGGAEVVGQ